MCVLLTTSKNTQNERMGTKINTDGEGKRTLNKRAPYKSMIRAFDPPNNWGYADHATHDL